MNAHATFPTLLAAVLLGAAPFGCGHTHTAEDTPAAPTAPKPRERRTSPDPERAVSTPIKSGRPDAPPLATSPAGLLKPEAVGAIQGKLVSRGRLSKADESGKLDEPTRKALREFQHENQLPATGMPDDATVQKLGLRPNEMFRAAQSSGGDGH